MTQAAPGWYPDPQDHQGLRYWDGLSWTEHRAATESFPPAAPSAPAGHHPHGTTAFHPGAPDPGIPYPGGPYPYGTYPMQAQTGNTLSVIGIVCGSLAFLVLPIILGPAGIVLGAVGRGKHEKLAPIAIGVSVAGTLVGMFLGIMVMM